MDRQGSKRLWALIAGLLAFSAAAVFAGGAAQAGDPYVQIAVHDSDLFAVGPITQSELQQTRGQGLDESPPNASGTGELAIILWDETKRGSTQPTSYNNGASTGMSSTIVARSF